MRVDPSASTFGTSREEFLHRVRSALGRGASGADAGAAAPSDHAPSDLGVVRLVDHDADLVGLFVERATAGGVRVHRARPSELSPTIHHLVSTLAARSAVVSVPGPMGEELERSLVAHGVAIVGGQPDGTLDALYDADVGITDGDAGLAESGTLVLRADARRGRGVFIVPPVHLAILRESQIMPDMLDYWPTLGPQVGSRSGSGTPTDPMRRAAAMPTSIVLVSGPSKTADIEGILITGVHGPREVHVVLVADVRK